MEQVIHCVLHRNELVVQRAWISDSASPAAERAVVVLVLPLEELEDVVELDLLRIFRQRSASAGDARSVHQPGPREDREGLGDEGPWKVS